MIRRFTSAQFVPANAGAKAKNPVGSTLFSTPMVALLRHPGHKILRTCCHESARKRLIGLIFGGKSCSAGAEGAEWQRKPGRQRRCRILDGTRVRLGIGKPLPALGL